MAHNVLHNVGFLKVLEKRSFERDNVSRKTKIVEPPYIPTSNDIEYLDEFSTYSIGQGYWDHISLPLKG